MPLKIVEAGSLDDKQSSKRRPAKWKMKELQPFSKKQIDPKDLPKRPGITYPRKKEKIITDPKKKKRYQDLLDKSRRTKSEKRNYIKVRKKYNIGGRANLLEEVGRLDAEKMNPNRRAEKKRVIGELNKGYKGGGMAQRGLGRAFMKGGKV